MSGYISLKKRERERDIYIYLYILTYVYLCVYVGREREHTYTYIHIQYVYIDTIDLYIYIYTYVEGLLKTISQFLGISFCKHSMTLWNSSGANLTLTVSLWTHPTQMQTFRFQYHKSKAFEMALTTHP